MEEGNGRGSWLQGLREVRNSREKLLLEVS